MERLTHLVSANTPPRNLRKRVMWTYKESIDPFQATANTISKRTLHPRCRAPSKTFWQIHTWLSIRVSSQNLALYERCLSFIKNSRRFLIEISRSRGGGKGPAIGGKHSAKSRSKSFLKSSDGGNHHCLLSSSFNTPSIIS